MRNSPIARYDEFGLCEWVDAGSGLYEPTPSFWADIRHHYSDNVKGTRLTFSVCCGGVNPYLLGYGIYTTDEYSPRSSEERPFPSKWHGIVSLDNLGRNCYTISIEVPTHAKWYNDDEVFSKIRAFGICCCLPGKGSQTTSKYYDRYDPPAPPPRPLPDPDPISIGAGGP